MALAASSKPPNNTFGFIATGFASSASTVFRCMLAAWVAIRGASAPFFGAGGSNCCRLLSYSCANLRRLSTFATAQAMDAFSAQFSTASQDFSMRPARAPSFSSTRGHRAVKCSRACMQLARLKFVDLSPSVVFATSLSKIARFLVTSAATSPALIESDSWRPPSGKPSKLSRSLSNLSANSLIASAVALSPDVVALMKVSVAYVWTLLKTLKACSEMAPMSLRCGHQGNSASNASKAIPALLAARCFSAAASFSAAVCLAWLMKIYSTCPSIGGSHFDATTATSFSAIASTLPEISFTSTAACTSMTQPGCMARMRFASAIKDCNNASAIFLLSGATSCILSTSSSTRVVPSRSCFGCVMP
mmetsp:Transcript_13926/g.37976  ORF Transcript_13926/g.37976 Transcript_13926/m.37976 type:complete len:362 (-) Transcript_13926:516-1601(-)